MSCSMYQYFIYFYCWIIFHCMDIWHLVIHSLIDRYLGCFHFLAIMNIMNIHVQVFLWTYIFTSLGYITRSRIAKSYGKSMFKLLKNCQTVFQSICTILHSFQQCVKVPVFPHLCQHIFLIIAILLVVKWNLIIVLICIILIITDVEHPFTYLLTIGIYSLEECLLKFSAHFIIPYLSFYY